MKEGGCTDRYKKERNKRRWDNFARFQGLWGMLGRGGLIGISIIVASHFKNNISESAKPIEGISIQDTIPGIKRDSNEYNTVSKFIDTINKGK